MFEIYDGRPFFWQWDVNQKMIVHCRAEQVHFCNGTSDCSLVTEAYHDEATGKTVANVPNELLQADGVLRVYAYVLEGEEKYTLQSAIFKVRSRTRPANYIYTPTEILGYDALDKRIKALEEGGGSSGGSSAPDYRLIAEYTVTADETPDSITIDKGLDGEPFFLSEIVLFGIFPALASGTNRSGYVCFNNEDRFTRYIASLYHPVDANKTNRLILKVNTAITGRIEYCHFPNASENINSTAQWYSFNPVDVNLIKQPIETITFSIHQGTFSTGTKIKVYGR